MTDLETESALQAIEAELQEHNESIGAEQRSPDRLRLDAKFFLMTRQGISVTTMCLMATDLRFRIDRYAKDVKQAIDLISQGRAVDAKLTLENTLLPDKW